MEDLQAQVLKVVKTFAKLLTERAAETKIRRNLEGLRLEKKAAETQRTLQSLQNGKLDLYEEYRSGKITREKFAAVQEERQLEISRLKDELTQIEQRIDRLKSGKERMKEWTENAGDIRVLTEYRPEVIGKLVKKIRVYGQGRIEIDLLSNDSFITELLESARRTAV